MSFKKRCTAVCGDLILYNFGHTDGGEDNFPPSGTFTSAVMDAQREVTWDSIRWDETLPSNTDVEFQVAVSNSPDGPFSFVGPNGASNSYFSTAAGQSLPVLKGRFLRYKAFLSSDGVDTCSFGNVQISFSGLQPSSVTNHEYDAAGNRTRKTVETDEGVILEEVLDDAGWSSPDRINTLNQVMRRDVTDSGGTTSWAFTWDADGNMTSKSDGVDTWDYTWNDESRLVRVEGPGGLDIEFFYDSAGRMLRRKDGAEEWLFEWSSWDLVRETDPSGVVTRYFCPEGEIHRFQRGADYYNVHSDALTSVRTISDATGAVVSHFEYDAWGHLLPSSVDGVPGGFPYRYVGALGVRWDGNVGLHFMRNRWYDPVSGRFVSRDPLGQAAGANLYRYCSNVPTDKVDPSGELEVPTPPAIFAPAAPTSAVPAAPCLCTGAARGVTTAAVTAPPASAASARVSAVEVAGARSSGANPWLIFLSLLLFANQAGECPDEERQEICKKDQREEIDFCQHCTTGALNDVCYTTVGENFKRCMEYKTALPRLPKGWRKNFPRQFNKKWTWTSWAGIEKECGDYFGSM